MTVPDSIFDRSRMSLIRFEQVGAGAVDRARELDLLGREVAVRVVAELLAEDQDAVERRAQLVRHVGEELGLVLRGERELGRLLLERAARLLDLLVLALDLDVVLGELLGLLLELLVGLLQLASAASAARRRAAATASSRPSVCIVASMLFSTMPMLAVSCSRNDECRSVKAPSEASSITALTWPSKSTGSTMTLCGCVRNRPDRIGTHIRGYFGYHHPPGIRGALPDQPLADPQAFGVARHVVIGIGREEPEAQPGDPPRSGR